MSKASVAAKQEAADRLRGWLKPGDTVFTVLRHVSRSGMQREIGVVLIKDENTVLHPNYAVAELLGVKVNKDGDGVVVGGAGMDMGFHLVYELASRLWPEGFGCIGEKCRSNDHSNGDRDRRPHGTLRHKVWASEIAAGVKLTIDHWHRDGGYALNHRWL